MHASQIMNVNDLQTTVLLSPYFFVKLGRR